MLKASQSAVKKPSGLPVPLCVFCAMRTTTVTSLVRRSTVRHIHNSGNSGNSPRDGPPGRSNDAFFPPEPKTRYAGFQNRLKSPLSPSAPPNQWTRPPISGDGKFGAGGSRGRNPNQAPGGGGFKASRLDSLFGFGDRGNRGDGGERTEIGLGSRPEGRYNNRQYGKDGRDGRDVNSGYGHQQGFQQSNAGGQFPERQQFSRDGDTGFAPQRPPFQSPPNNNQGYNQHIDRSYPRDNREGNSNYTGRQSFQERPGGEFTRRPFPPRDNDRAPYAPRDQQFDRNSRYDNPYLGNGEAGRYPASAPRFGDRRQEAPVEKRTDEYIPSRQRVVDPAYEKRQSAKLRDRERNRRVFDDTESAILEEDEEELRGKAARKAKKAKKKEAKVDDTPKMIPLLLPEYISVANLARAVKVKLEDFTNQLLEMGFEGVSHDHILNAETAGLIAMEYNYEPIVDKSESVDLLPRPVPEDKSILPPRPPVVTIMGHVDHGKTTLLDWLRKSSIVDQEHGGITQHIGAFSVTLASGQNITFLDTPGHEAFLSMRERGANVTDIVILVVAADDSVKPQTIEAIKHAKAAKVPIIVAVNKIDKDEADVERVKGDLARYGVEVEDYGGDTQAIPVSGKTGQGMDDLEEATVLLSEILDMRAEPDGPCEGWVLEAMTKKRGRVATVLVKRGTLRHGDIIVAGQTWAKVRTLVNEHGVEVDFAAPGTPVEVDGWRDQPEAGDLALQAETEDRAKDVVAYRQEKAERLRQAADMEAINEQRKLLREKEEAHDAIRQKASALGEDPEHAVLANERSVQNAKPKFSEINFVIKADVSGSAEAVVNAISSLGNAEIRAKVIKSSFGPVTEFDIDHAAAAEGSARKVSILTHNIIYHLVEDVKAKLSEKLEPIIKPRVTGEAEIAKIYDIKIRGKLTKPIAGCRVKTGSVTRNAKIRVLRNNETIYQGSLTSLRNVKTDVQELKKGAECGMGFKEWDAFVVGDLVQCYEETMVPRSL
ncbi:translation initiation factor IF-2 [Rhizina undulata]